MPWKNFRDSQRLINSWKVIFYVIAGGTQILFQFMQPCAEVAEKVDFSNFWAEICDLHGVPHKPSKNALNTLLFQLSSNL